MRGRYLPVLVLVGVVLAVYGASLAGRFVWDDAELIVAKAPFFTRAGSAAAILASSDTGLYSGATPYYRPLTTLSFLASYRLFGLDPFWWRLTSLLLHAAVVLLLYALVARAFGDERLGFVAALLFAVHPAAVEAVAFVTARNNLLCAAGLLAALLALLRRTPLATAAALGLFAAALLSKEPAVVLPPFLLGLALLARDPRLKARPPVLGLFFALLAGYLLLRAAVLGAVAPAAGGGDPAAHARLVVGSLYESLRILAWPVPLNAAYGPSAAAFSFGRLAAVAAALGALGWAAVARRTPEPLRAASLWLLLGFLPISNLVPIPSAPVAERYLYVPLLGFAVLLAAGAQAIAARRPRLAAAVVLLVVAALGVRSALRAQVWLDDRRLYESMVAADPANASALYNLGQLEASTGNLPAAIAAWEGAVHANPTHVGAHNNLGNAYALAGRYPLARQHFERARALDPAEAMVLYNLARVAELDGRPDEAAALYADYVRADARATDPQRQALVARARVRARSLAGSSSPGSPAH